MTLADLNALDRARFVAALGWIFEDSPWVAERAWPRRPFASVDELHAAMVAAVDSAPLDEQLALLRAHPDLGMRLEGRRMSEASTGEQTRAGLDRLTPDEAERLRRLNAVYREKFGYPFIFAVAHRRAEEIVAALEQRLAHDAEAELAEGLRQVSRIAQFRLADAVR